MVRSSYLVFLVIALWFPLVVACSQPTVLETTPEALETTEDAPAEATRTPQVIEEEATEEATEVLEDMTEEATEEIAEDIPTDAATETMEEATREATADTGVTTPVGGEEMRLGLVTDVGRVNDGTFNEFAHMGAQLASVDFGLDYRYIETQSQSDYLQNIQTLVDEDFNIIVTVGFLIAEATLESARENPDITFIGIDQSFTGERALPNLVGIQFREDQGGFLAGALAGMMTESNVVGFIGGVDVPAVKRFRNGFLNGVQYINPDAIARDVYIPSFTEPVQGASAAQQFIGDGADVIFGAGGPTGSGAISAAAEQDVYVIGVDQDEYNTTFGGGTTPGADKLLTSAVKRVDVGVYDQVQAIVQGSFTGNGDYILDVANDGITYADFHEASDSIPQNVKDRLEEIRQKLGDGSLSTGVDPATGDLDEEEIPPPEPFEG